MACGPEDAPFGRGAAPERGEYLRLELYLDAAGDAWIRGRHGGVETIEPLNQLVTDAQDRIKYAVTAASAGLR